MPAVERSRGDARAKSQPSSSFPDRGLFRPGAVAIPASERRGRFLEGAGVAARLVARHSCPVQRPRCAVGLPEPIDDLAKLTLGFLPSLRLEGALAETELQLGEEIRSLEKSFHAVLLRSVRIQLEDRRGPLRAVTLTESLEVGRLLPHVQTRGDEVLRDEAGDAFIRVDLGIQPSAATSHRRSAEVEQHGLALGLCVAQHLIDVMPPIDLHVSSIATRNMRMRNGASEYD